MARTSNPQQHAALRHAQGERELQRLLLESIADYAVYAIDVDGYIQTWNAGAQRLKGYDAGEIIGQHYSRFFTPEDVAAGKPMANLAAARRDGRYEEEGWRLRKDGSRFWANIVLTPLRDESGEIIGFAKVTRDLTQRRAAEEEARRAVAERVRREAAEARREEVETLNTRLQEQAIELEAQMEEAQALTEELEQSSEELQHALASAEEARAGEEEARARAERASRAKTEFLATMSHELRTPLNAIAGHVDLLRLGVYGPVTDKQDEALRRVQAAEQRLLALINDVLNLARVEAGRVEYHIERVPLPGVITEVEGLLETQLAAKDIHLATRFDDAVGGSDDAVLADRERMSQILLNVLSNAVKFAPAGGRIDVDIARCGDEPSMVCITVADDGPGIPPDKLESVFEPFVQLDRTRTSNMEGSGLGLSISRDLARGMGGDLRAIAGREVGAMLVLRLPAAPAMHDQGT